MDMTLTDRIEAASEPTRKGAVISPCGKYRYRLTREVNPAGKGMCVFVMLNPSTADAQIDDPTIRRCIRFASDWGFAELSVVNLFAYRATSPDDMKRADEPIGPDNRFHVKTASLAADMIIAAWGAHGNYMDQDKRVLEWMESRDVYALGVTKDNHPRHPLYLKADSHPVLFKKEGTALLAAAMKARGL